MNKDLRFYTLLFFLTLLMTFCISSSEITFAQKISTANNGKPEKISSSTESTNQQLVQEVKKLVKAVNSLVQQQKAQVAVILLQTQQARLTTLEAQITDANRDISMYKFQKQDLSKRLENIKNEVISRGFLDQAEGERKIKAEIEADQQLASDLLSQTEQKLTRIQNEHQQLDIEMQKTNNQVSAFLTSETELEEKTEEKQN